MYITPSLYIASVVETSKFDVYSGTVNSGTEKSLFGVSSGIVSSVTQTYACEYYSVITSTVDLSSNKETSGVFIESIFDT